MSSSISRVSLSSLESQCRNAIRNQILYVFTLAFPVLGGCIDGTERKLCVEELRCILGGVILYFWNMGPWRTDRLLSKQIYLKSAPGEKKTSPYLWGANCSTTSILFIAMWIFLVAAHLCADWAVKILSSCSEWAGSHIQGHYALGVRKIKHQIKADLGPFNCPS